MMPRGSRTNGGMISWRLVWLISWRSQSSHGITLGGLKGPYTEVVHPIHLVRIRTTKNPRSRNPGTSLPRDLGGVRRSKIRICSGRTPRIPEHHLADREYAVSSQHYAYPPAGQHAQTLTQHSTPLPARTEHHEQPVVLSQWKWLALCVVVERKTMHIDAIIIDHAKTI